MRVDHRISADHTIEKEVHIATIKLINCIVARILRARKIQEIASQYSGNVISLNSVKTHLMMCGWLSSQRMLISVIKEDKSSSESFFFEIIFTAYSLRVTCAFRMLS
jgi:hypothetical protein